MNELIETQMAESIAKAWQETQAIVPDIRIREAAKALNSSEAQLVATMVGKEAIRLKSDWKNLLKRLPELGRVMSLTRNDACILEHKGVFEKVRVFGKKDHHMAIVIGPIETRIFLKSWHVAFAVKQQKKNRLLTSLQFFDHEGHAITKIYLEKESNYEAYEALVKDFKSNDQGKEQEVSVYPPEIYEKDLDIESLLQDWSNLKDTHDFFPMLKNHKAQRYHAVELAEGKFTYQVNISTVQEILEKASMRQLPIMIFVGNRGNLQIHQGTVRTIRLLERGHTSIEKWLNVLDPNFNMHLKMNLVHTAWVVSKPTNDGIITSVEFYDKKQRLIVQFFGLRKPGSTQNADWSALVSELPKVESSAIE
ncbi:MAG: ChuX/HutX family heme-like substrate-binding protein [Bacteroidota bacterium]